MTRIEDRPLLDMAQGRDQDDRSALLAAYFRVLQSHRRREVTDLHVRELLTYVLVNNRDGRGVQMSHDDVANTLCCERSTARKVVDRAEVVYGLLAVTEDRYVRGGQAPNRYSIDWQAVRTVNAGSLPQREYQPDTHASSGINAMAAAPSTEHGADPCRTNIATTAEGSFALVYSAKSSAAVAVPRREMEAEPGATTGHPGATMYHPPATQWQGAATTGHPYKEDTLTSSLTLKRAAAAEAAAKLFKDLDFEELKRQANKLLNARPVLGRDYVWQVIVVAEALERGYSGDLITKLASGDVRKPRSYLDAAMRGECERHGLDWPCMREVVRK